MSNQVRHQVFVSSTYTDLQDERAEVIQALWELDCIPTGMEAFVASNEGQWEVIKKVIDESDYYVLIIGGRYGSVTAEGISYTEKEYRYAKSLGIPILGFVHKDPSSIPVGKTETTPASQELLAAFRKEVMDAHPVGFFATAAELGSIVSRSVIRQIRTSPRPGWVRNDGSSRIELLEKIAELTEENQRLRNAVQLDVEVSFDDSLQHGSDPVTVRGTRDARFDFMDEVKEEWGVKTSWDAILRDLGPALISEASEWELRTILSRYNETVKSPSGAETFRPLISDSSWGDILIQLRALGLIEPGTKKRAVSDRGSYWKLTKKGDNYLVSLLAKRKGN